jgi:YD repeat-containing protein
MHLALLPWLRRWRHALQDKNRQTPPEKPAKLWKDLKHFLDIERLEDRNSIADAVGPVLTTSALSLTGQLMQMIVSERIDLPLSMPVPRTQEPSAHVTETGTLAVAPRDTTPAANHLDIGKAPGSESNAAPAASQPSPFREGKPLFGDLTQDGILLDLMAGSKPSHPAASSSLQGSAGGPGGGGGSSGASSPVASSSATGGSALVNSGAADSGGSGGTAAGTASGTTPATSSGSAGAAASFATRAAVPGTGTGSGLSTSPSAGPLGPSGGGGGGPLTADSLSVDVVDQNNGLVLSANVPVNDFSTYGVTLDAEYFATGLVGNVSSYSWDLTNAPDATSISGTSTYRLTFTWASFTGAARSDTVKVTVTASDTSQASKSIKFIVAGTSSPAYSATRPTTSGTWASLLPPDALMSPQHSGCCCCGSYYYSVGQADGQLQTTHTLPAYNPNMPPLQLMYVSTAANPQPIFIAHYQLPPGVTVPGSITATLTFDGLAGSPHTITTNGGAAYLAAGDTMQIGLQAPSGASTGRHSYSFQVVDTNASPQTTTYSGSVNVLNYSSNAFGAGWSLAGVERIFSATGGVILDLGNGESLWFANGQQSGTFVRPPGDFSTLTQNTSTFVYTRTMPDGTAITFTSDGSGHNGFQTAVTDRNGNTTSYGLNASNQITTITDMNNQVTTFTYSGSNVTAVSDPANHITTLGYSSGNLTSLKDADGSLWTYTYDSSRDLTVLKSALNTATTFTYSNARISSINRPDGTSESFIPSQTQGLVTTVSGRGYVVSKGQAVYTDPRSNAWNTHFDWLGFGEANSQIDPLGNTALTHHDANGLAWMRADYLGNRYRDFFDSLGNVTKEVQPDDTTWQYTYNGFSEVLQTTDPRANLTTAAYDSHGNMTQFKDALGNLATNTYTSKGLLSTATDQLGHTTSYAYDSLNRQTTVTDPLGDGRHESIRFGQQPHAQHRRAGKSHNLQLRSSR